MNRRTIVIALFVLGSTAYAQSIDWIQRIPLLQTGWQYPGEAQVFEDSVRKRLMTVGWRLGTIFRSDDNGASWQGQYALGTDVVGKYGVIYVAPDGRYIWHGQTPWNQRVALVSSDGGETWRTYTQDTLVAKDGLHRGLLTIIPPYNIRAYESLVTGGHVMSSDLGRTWRRIQYPPADNPPVSEAREMIAAPNMLYRTGRPYMYRFDASKDTTWTQTRVIGNGRFTKEVGSSVVTVVSNTLYVYQTWSDTTPQILRTWKDDVTGDTIALSIGDVQRYDDSTVYAYDARGWIFEVRPRTRHIRCIQPFGAAFPKPASGITLRPDFLWASIYNEYCVAITNINQFGWCVAELRNGKVLRVDTVPSRTPYVVANGQMPYNYYGERGIFMFKISTGNFREIVRTTDLGASWIHTTKVESEELEPTFLGARTSVRAPDGTLLIHTTRDHCVIPDDRGSIERTYELTGFFGRVFDPEQRMLNDRFATLYRDEDRVLLPGRTLMTYDYKLGTSTSTVLPRKTAFVRRLSSSMMAAGADSLWMTFDNGREWVFVSATLTSPVAQPRGQFSDAARTSSGVLLSAVRGVDFKDVGERRGILSYGGIGRSVDNGDTWQWVTNLPDSMRFISRIERVNDSVVLAIGGRMLVDSASIRDVGTYKIEVDASAILMSTDAGASWNVATRDIRTGMQRGDHEPDICVVGNGVVLASLHSGFPFISTTSGRTWSVLDIPELGLASVHSFRREDNGDIMICTSSGAGNLRLPGVTSVESEQQDARADNTAWVANNQLYVRIDQPQTRVHVVSVDGRTIIERVCDPGVATVDVSPYAHGVYGVETITSTQTTHRCITW
jgi:hypothetical protein